MVHTKEWKKNWKPPKIVHNKPTKFNYVVVYPEKLELGKYVDIGAFTYIQASQGVIIEDDVEIGGGCHIYSESTIDMKKGTVRIKKNAKIGAHCVIMPRVTIGENSIIGACSFINNDVIDNVIVFGVPCVIRGLNELYYMSR